MQSPLLQVDGLTINFETANGFFSAVKDVSFQLNSGETLAIVGESGSGKSVTALSILQLLSSKASIKGNIIFRRDAQTAIPLHAPSANAKFHYRGKDIAMIFQEPMTALNPVYTCGNQVIESIQLHQHLDKKAAKAATIELFKKVELPNPEAMFNRYPHELSGGQKQRVMIAMAISGNPSLLIADEPTTALDVTVQKSIITLLQSLQQQMGMAIIFITHDLGLVADIANTVLVMQNGVAVEMGETASVFNAPKALYTQALLACRVALYEKGQRLPVVAQWLSGNTPSLSTSSEVSVSNPTLYSSTPILQVKDLEVGYTTKSSIFKRQSAPVFKAVNGVSFDVFEGETVGLVGESGCGKTTVGKAILQLIQANKGSIQLNGTELNTLSGAALRAMRKNLQIVFQDPYGSLNPRLTI
ncbi:MAG: ATP-binding cassette domain-containing protein, partial [Ferruginibacter sp.]